MIFHISTFNPRNKRFENERTTIKFEKKRKLPSKSSADPSRIFNFYDPISSPDRAARITIPQILTRFVSTPTSVSLPLSFSLDLFLSLTPSISPSCLTSYRPSVFLASEKKDKPREAHTANFAGSPALHMIPFPRKHLSRLWNSFINPHILHYAHCPFLLRGTLQPERTRQFSGGFPSREQSLFLSFVFPLRYVIPSVFFPSLLHFSSQP